MYRNQPMFLYMHLMTLIRVMMHLQKPTMLVGFCTYMYLDSYTVWMHLQTLYKKLTCIIWALLKGTILSRSEQTFNMVWNRCSTFKMNTVTENYWLIYAEAMWSIIFSH